MNEQAIQSQLAELLDEIEADPENTDLLNDAGVGHYLLGNYERAVHFLKRAAEGSNHPSHWFNLGNAYSELQHLQQALEAYLRTLEVKPDHTGALTHAADLYDELGEDGRARELFEYLTRLSPDDPLPHFNLANFLLRQNEHMKAAKLYEKVIEMDWQFADAYYNIAWILLQAKAYEESFEYAEKGLSVDPHHNELRALRDELRDRQSA
ncbi:MAG: tetratricopeptide repeat protein [Balneolaceae bacterium]